jgi:hypothetical protein
LRFTFAVFRQEHRAVIGFAKISPQREYPRDALAFPVF